MDLFKLYLFKKEYRIDFPNFKHLSSEETLVLTNKILRKYELSNINAVIDVLFTDKDILSNVDANNGLNLINILSFNKIKPMQMIYINWFKFDNIDKLNLCDLNKYFLDIWYPCSDDIDVFDDSLEWILSIRHDGSVSLFR